MNKEKSKIITSYVWNTLSTILNVVKAFTTVLLEYLLLPLLWYKNYERSKFFKHLGMFIWAPTYLFAEFKKKCLSKEERSALIKRYNNFRLSLSVALLPILAIIDGELKFSDYEMGELTFSYGVLVFIFAWSFPMSRCNEFFFSFIKDALDKLGGKSSTSNLTYEERILLALKSYLELVINFAIIWLFLPQEWFSCKLHGVFDALYYSGVTITTLGYGDISPSYWIPQMLSVYEVFCGFILLIVSFTIYVGRGLSETTAKPSFRGRLRTRNSNKKTNFK